MDRPTPQSILLTRRFLLDTNIISFYLSGDPAAFELFHAWIENEEAATSMVMYAEMYRYIIRLPDASERIIAFHRLLEKVPAYPFTSSTEKQYTKIREAMPPRLLKRIGDPDLFIAATALDHGLTVVTADSDFNDIPYVSVRYFPRSTFR